ncbi:MAG: diguanylate cyclase [Actinomycetota bacterium]|nr:diguanylate cyclase [Actinomycetota bacterium]
MAKPLKCPTCGELVEPPRCPSCGSELPANGVAEVLELPLDDRDQTWSDRDQSVSDLDQTWADHDQTASDSDQRSSDEDQEASDEDASAGGDSVTHRQTTRARARTSVDRAQVSQLRDEGATVRLENAAGRDTNAALRDQDGGVREEIHLVRGVEDSSDEDPEDFLTRAKKDRARAASDRAKAADDRARAAVDREQASRDRAKAHENRTESAKNLKLSTTDELTGAWTRQFGLGEISRELERAHRTGGKLTLAFIDVDDLKTVNDTQGHIAGDALLRMVGETLHSNVRAYDLIVRYGGDEFVCAMPNLTTAQARVRMEKIAATLTSADEEHSITFGLAEAEPSDSLKELIARADAALLAEKR